MFTTDRVRKSNFYEKNLSLLTSRRAPMISCLLRWSLICLIYFSCLGASSKGLLSYMTSREYCREYNQYLTSYISSFTWSHDNCLVIWTLSVIKSPRYTWGDFMFLYWFVRCRCRRPQILVHTITFEQLFGFLSVLAQLLALTCRLPD